MNDHRFPGVPQLNDPIAIAAFEGWNDAGDAASGAVDHLSAIWEATTFAELDPEQYHDFQVNRPQVRITGDGRRTIHWPTTRLSWARPPGSSRDVVLIRGIEPSMRWRTFCDEVLDAVDATGARMLVTLGAMLADVPHTRPLPVTTTSDDPALIRRLALEPSQYEGPTGIVGVLQQRAGDRHLSGVSLWAAVPHYVAQAPSPKAVLALLSRVEDLLELTVPLDELPQDAEAWEHGVDQLAAEDDEIGQYVRQLEQAKDTTELPEASGEAIARDFERYLRRRDDG